MYPATYTKRGQSDPIGSKHLLVGESPAMQEVKKEILLTARNDITVLIVGESGAGKELVAHAIHQHSNRNKGPFKAINCGSVTESLLEARLFGHTKGAFTGANSSRSGLFEAANGGTILLDEIGDMPMNLQGYLLRVLQERTIMPIGADTERKIDVRVIAATNKDLSREIREGRFREDLYYRLNEFQIRVPALRERPSDIPSLVRFFLGPVEIEERALDLLCHHQWPGNVRELKAITKRPLLRAESDRIITAAHVLRELEQTRDVITYTVTLRKGDSLDKHLREQKLAIYKAVLNVTGSHAGAAEWLSIDPKALHHRVSRVKRHVRTGAHASDASRKT